MLTKLDTLVRAHLGHTFPACSMCVYHHDSVVYEGAWGVIDPETQSVPTSSHTLFDLASLTKLFTTTAFLGQVSEGKVRIDDPIVNLLPEFGAIAPRRIDGGQDPHSKVHLPTPPEREGQRVNPLNITFRHLLTHTSGLPPWRDVYNAAGNAPPPPPEAFSVEERRRRWWRGLAALNSYPFVAPPDGVVRYSDIGLMLLGEAIARCDRSNLDAVIRRRVLSALDIPSGDHLCFNPLVDRHLRREQIAPTEDDPVWRKRRVWGEVHDENCCGLGGITGHAGLFGTARALAHFGYHWMHDPRVFGIRPDIAQQAVSQQAETNGTRRGLGFALKAAADSMAGDRMSLRAFGHSGFTGTTLWIDPEAGVVVALLTNSVYYGRHSQGYANTHIFRRAVHDLVMEALA